MNAKNLYQGGSQIKVFAEGVVSSINEQVAKVQVKRMGKDLDMSTGTLVRAPNEFARVKAQLKNFDQLKMEVNPYISEVKMREDSEEDEGNLVSALVFIGGIVGFLTIAF